jgi:hypothetical protein
VCCGTDAGRVGKSLGGGWSVAMRKSPEHPCSGNEICYGVQRENSVPLFVQIESNQVLLAWVTYCDPTASGSSVAS